MCQLTHFRFAPFLLLAAALLIEVARAAEDLRFSVLLNVADRNVSGLTKLTSDQVAVVDALVRRDTATRAGTNPTPAKTSENPSATFSQRITEKERSTAGLTSLSAAEIARLDAFVERHQGAKLARTLLAPPAYLSRRSNLTPTERKAEREIHGSFSLSYAVGSGGYSEKTGSMMLTMEDPARRYSITFGYTESHIKGGNGYYRDPFYDPSRMMLPDDPLRP
ncbi:MAG: hypothetical protein EXS37_15625 [Opitutus sp.]|nr:hypothetical protein [Opitutus sp.]